MGTSEFITFKPTEKDHNVVPFFSVTIHQIAITVLQYVASYLIGVVRKNNNVMYQIYPLYIRVITNRSFVVLPRFVGFRCLLMVSYVQQGLAPDWPKMSTEATTLRVVDVLE